jgi:hypothetical protein
MVRTVPYQEMTQDPPSGDRGGRERKEALAWCLVWLMFPEIGIGQFPVSPAANQTPPRKAGFGSTVLRFGTMEDELHLSLEVRAAKIRISTDVRTHCVSYRGE